MYRQEFFIVAKKDEDENSSNYHRLLALRSDHAGTIVNETKKWTDNIFLAKHFRSESDAILFASKQLNSKFISSVKPDYHKSNYIETDYKIVKVFFDVEGNSVTTKLLYTYNKENK